MRYVWLFIISIGLAAGLGCAKTEQAAIEIGDIQITAKEFNDAFQKSRYAYDAQNGKQEFLENLISKKLILSEAEKLGLDKDPELLNNLQIFWEQALLKLTLVSINQKFSDAVQVTDREIKDYYQKQNGFAGKSLAEVQEQIKSILIKEKQSQLILNWVNTLKEQSDINIDYTLLGINNPK